MRRHGNQKQAESREIILRPAFHVSQYSHVLFRLDPRPVGLHIQVCPPVLDSMVAMHPYYVARAIGGLLFLLGTIVGAYNIWMTIRTAPQDRREPAADLPVPANASVRTFPAGD